MSASLPTIYDDASMAALMAGWMGPTAVMLGWTVEGDSYADPITDAVIMYGGITDLSGATDIAKIRAYARIAVWNAAASSLAASVDWSRGAESVRSSQAYANAVKQAERARIAAADEGYPVGPVQTLKVITPTYTPDPYKRATRLRTGRY